MARGAGHDELRRAVARLDRLDDAIVRTAAGPVLLDVVGVRHPARLLDACRRGALDLAALREGLELRRDPRPLHATLVARAHRDLKAIEATPEHLALLLDAPRSLRRSVGRGPDWLAARRRRIDVMRAALAPAGPADLAVHVDRPGDDLAAIAARSPWLAAALDLAAAIHGPASARAALDLLRRSLSRGTSSIREPRRRALALLRRLVGGERRPLTAEGAEGLALAALARDALAPVAPRQQLRRLRRAVLAALCWPAPPPDADPAPDVDLPEPPAGPRPADMSLPPGPDLLAALRRYLDAAAAALFAPLTRDDQAVLDERLAHAALAFPIDPDAPAWGRAERELAARLPDLHDQLRAPGLPLAGALWLAGADLQPHARAALATWLAGGLVLDDLAAVPPAKLFALLRLDDVGDAQRYCFWLARLAPHFKALGVDLDLDPGHVANLPSGRRSELGLLAHCLLQHAPTPSPATVQRDLAALDATLGLFRGLPAQARALLARIGAVTPGRGRALHPEFAAWLGDDPLLDRYCHLRELLGEPPDVSNTLRGDFDARDRLERQLAHLRGLPAPTGVQRALIERLGDRLARGELPGPEWTHRRMTEQVGELRVRAFRRQLDAALAEVLRATFGVELPRLTPTWRDVVRFYLGGDWTRRQSERNRVLLGELLRAAAAAPGRPVTRSWPKNLAWIAAARARIDPDAWLRPRRLACRVGDRACVLVAEDDPLEVLRMGIPFDTCLSLRGGMNAPSAVLNAVDVNKRVLYLRADDGAILARQLLALDGDHRLLRYHLYSALGADETALFEGLFDQVVQDMAKETGVTPIGDGLPPALHGGFWYDDGALAPPVAADDVAALLAERGLPDAPDLSGWERRQLRGLLVLRRGDAATALGIVSAHDDPLRARLAQLAIAGIGEAACRARAVREVDPAVALVARALASPAHLSPEPPAPQPATPPDLSPAPPAPQPAAPPEPPAPQPRPPASARPRPAIHTALAIAAAAPPDRRIAGLVTGAETDLAPDPTLVRPWLAAAEQLVARGDDSDDGIVHHTFFLARHLALLPVAELLDLAPRIEALWDRFLVEATSCSDCRDRAREDLGFAAEAAFRRDPDARAVLGALADARGPAPRLRLALHLAARYPLERRLLQDMSLTTCSEDDPQVGAVAAALARLERPPTPCPAALRALRELARRRPELAREPDHLAACLRHRDPRRPLDLPPGRAPLAVCAELVLHAADLLAGHADPGVVPAAWRPGRWELALHRRAATPWRRALARAAARGDLSARTWSLLLGDRPAAPVDARLPPESTPQLGAAVALAGAAATARAIAEPGVPLLDLAAGLQPLVLRAPAALDPAVHAAALRALRSHAPEDMSIPTGLFALDLLLAEDDHSLRLALLDLVLAAPPAPARAGLAAALLQRMRPRLDPLTGRHIVALWAIEGAREALVGLLTTSQRYNFARTLTAILRAAGDDLAAAEAILTAWFAAQAAADTWVEEFECPAAPPGLILRALLAGGGPTAFLRAYDAGDPLRRLALLDQLDAHPPALFAALRDALADVPADQRNLGHRWLAARCEARLADIR